MTRTVIESKTKTVTIGFDEPFCVIGERINPTGRKKLAAELEAGNFETVLRDALEQTKELVGTQGVFTINPHNHNGMDTRARVMMTVKGGRWTLAQ